MKLLLPVILATLLACATARAPAPAIPPPVSTVPVAAAPEPETARPLTVLYGLGLAQSNQGAVCDRRGERCAVTDLNGRTAIIDRATGSVLATEFFDRSHGGMAFDESGARLGMGTADWDWRSGEVHEYTPSRRPSCIAVSPRRVAWIEGPQFGGVARIQVKSRVSAPSQVPLELASADIKYLVFAGDDLLLVAHNDAVDAWALGGPAPQRWSVQLEPESGERWRPYSGNPRIQLTRDRVLLKVTGAELRVLTRKLEPVRTLQLHREESIFPDPGSDRFVRVRPLDERRVQLEVEGADSAKVLASTVIESSSRVQVRFWEHRLVLNHARGALIWDLRSAPTPLWENRRSTRPLVVVANDQLEESHGVVRFRALDGTHTPREATSFAQQLLPSGLALRGDHAIVRSGYGVEAWGPTGRQDPDQEDQLLALGPQAELNRLLHDEQGHLLEGPAGQVTRVKVGQDDWVRGLAIDSKRTRAVVVLKEEWRLYDLTTGRVMRSGRCPGWHRTVAAFQPGGRTFVVIDEEQLLSYSSEGRELARLRYPRVPPDGITGGSGDQPTARVVWTSVGFAVSLWSDPEVWFLKAPSLEVLGRSPRGGGLERLTSGVAVLAQRGGPSLHTEGGALRKHVTLPPRALTAVSADGSLVAYCEEAAVTVLDELGNRVDGDASLCEGASALAVSPSHLAVVFRGEVRLLRRDDRSRWTVRSFSPGNRMRGPGRGDGPPPPPSRLLVVQQGARFGLSDSVAGPFVTVFGGSPTATPELFAELWR